MMRLKRGELVMFETPVGWLTGKVFDETREHAIVLVPDRPCPDSVDGAWRVPEDEITFLERPADTLAKADAMGYAQKAATEDGKAWAVYWKNMEEPLPRGGTAIVTSWYARPLHEYGAVGPNGATRLCFYDAVGKIWWGE